MSEPLAAREAPASYLVESVDRASARHARPEPAEAVELKPDLPAIPKGYKQTEVGVIPEDWEVRKLGELASFRTGPFGSALHKSDYTSDGVPVINPMHIVNGQIVPSQNMTITEFAATKLSEFRLKPNEIIIGRRGDMGRCAVVKQEHLGWLCGTGSMIVRPSSTVDPVFLQRVLASPSVVSAIEDASVGTTMINLNQTTLSGLVIQAPSLREQEAIAAALSDADALIASLEQLIAKKRSLKQGAMQELLTGKKRLPGFGGEWKKYCLRDCLLTNPDYGINAPGVPSSGDLPAYLRITDIDDDGHFIANNRVAVNHPQALSYVLNENEIVFARTGASVGKTYLYDPADGTIVFAGFLIRARLDCSRICPAFLAALTRTKCYWDWVRVMSMRSGQPGINGNEYSSLELHLPPLPEQTAIATILFDMDAEIAALETQLAKARGIKQGMMQELLTGRIRLV